MATTASNISEKITALAGRTILVGKTPGGNDLMVSVNIDGKINSGSTDRFGKVPGTVSRCKPELDIAHCRIIIGNDNTVTVANIKSENYTFVNGMEVITKKINAKSVVELGPNRFRIDIVEIIAMAHKLICKKQIVPSPIPPAEKRLKTIREKFDTRMIQSRQSSGSNITACNSFTILAVFAGITTIVLKKAIPDAPFYFAALAITALSTALTLVKFVSMYKMEHIDSQRSAIKEFTESYTCPHCGTFIGDIPYNKLTERPSCPECRKNLLNN